MKNIRIRNVVNLASLAFVPTVVACNISSAGDSNSLQFSPSDCGLPLGSCDFMMYDVAAGSKMKVQVPATSLMSSDNSVLSATPYSPGIWQLVAGVGSGTVTLTATTDDGMSDTIHVTVTPANKLGLVQILGKIASGPMESGSGMLLTENWVVDAGKAEAFQVVPFESQGKRLMGQLFYKRDVPTITGEQMGSSIADGLLILTLPPSTIDICRYSVDNPPAAVNLDIRTL